MAFSRHFYINDDPYIGLDNDELSRFDDKRQILNLALSKHCLAAAISRRPSTWQVERLDLWSEQQQQQQYVATWCDYTVVNNTDITQRACRAGRRCLAAEVNTGIAWLMKDDSRTPETSKMKEEKTATDGEQNVRKAYCEIHKQSYWG